MLLGNKKYTQKLILLLFCFTFIFSNITGSYGYDKHTAFEETITISPDSYEIREPIRIKDEGTNTYVTNKYFVYLNVTNISPDYINAYLIS